MGIAWLGPVLVYSLLLGVAGLLLFFAFRRKGLLPPDACLCGYSTEGNDSGICPECGQPLRETIEKAERRRLLTAGRRLAYSLLAIGLCTIPVLSAALRMSGERVYSDCRTLLAPFDGSYKRAELTWRVRRDTPGATNPADVAITSSGGVTSRKSFSPKPDLGAVRDDAAAWAASLGADPAASGGSTLRELGEAVEAATQGREVLLVGGKDAAHTLLASGSVVTKDERRWPMLIVGAVYFTVAGVMGVWVFRRAIGRATIMRGVVVKPGG